MTTTTVSASPSLLSYLVLTPEVAALLDKSYGKSSAKPKGSSKLAKAKAAKGEKSKKSVEITWVIKAPKVQDHAMFLSVMREAGIRYRDVERTDEVTGEIVTVRVAYFDAVEHRKDAQFAVALYAGWTDEPWGTQIDRATNHARFSLQPKGASYAHRSPEAHSARWTASGWTKGAPDAFEKIEQDLGARERLAVEELSTMDALYEMAGKDKAGFERRLMRLAKDDPGLAALVRQRPDLLATMRAIAEERLASVRADIAGFNFADMGEIEKRYAALNSRGLPAFVEAVALLNEMSKS